MNIDKGRKWHFDFEVQGNPHHLEVSQPMGAGGVYYVTMDKYHEAQIVNTIFGWIMYCHKKVMLRILTGDDLGVIMDLIEGRE